MNNALVHEHDMNINALGMNNASISEVYIKKHTQNNKQQLSRTSLIFAAMMYLIKPSLTQM